MPSFRYEFKTQKGLFYTCYAYNDMCNNQRFFENDNLKFKIERVDLSNLETEIIFNNIETN